MWIGLTVFAAGVEVFDVVVEANSDGGEAQLPLQARHQPVVQGPGPLCADHGADGPKHASVADPFHGRLLPLNLGGVTICTIWLKSSLQNRGSEDSGLVLAQPVVTLGRELDQAENPGICVCLSGSELIPEV